MQAFLAFVLLLGLAATAEAKPAPAESPARTLAPEDLAIAVGPAGAMLESDYFRAPQKPYAAGRVFPCRLQLRPFDKMRLAQSCN